MYYGSPPSEKKLVFTQPIACNEKAIGFYCAKASCVSSDKAVAIKFKITYRVTEAKHKSRSWTLSILAVKSKHSQAVHPRFVLRTISNAIIQGSHELIMIFDRLLFVGYFRRTLVFKLWLNLHEVYRERRLYWRPIVLFTCDNNIILSIWW